MLLSMENLNISFLKNKDYVPVVRHLNMHISAGEMLGIVGESGSGKSLTNSALMGLLPRTAQCVASKLEFKKRDLLSFTPKDWRLFRGNEIAMVFQNAKSALNPSMKIKTHLIECIKRKNPDLGRKKIWNTANYLLEQVGLSSGTINLESYPHELSGGLAQKFMIAMALASNPSLLIADEITTGLDILHKRQVLKLLDELRREKNLAILIVSHDINLIQEYTQRMHVMYSGELMEAGSTQTLMASPSHPYTQGLINCLPKRTGEGTKQYLNTIDGFVLPITETTEGCRFYNRCPVAHSKCLVKPVIKNSLDPHDRYVNCHLGINHEP